MVRVKTCTLKHEFILKTYQSFPFVNSTLNIFRSFLLKCGEVDNDIFPYSFSETKIGETPVVGVDYDHSGK